MKTIFFVGLQICAFNALGSEADAIRGYAPMTALLLDAHTGNESSLKKAYLEQELDFFLDVEIPSNAVTRNLNSLREIGRLIESGDFQIAEQRLTGLRGFENEKLYLRGVLDGAERHYERSLDSFRKLIDNRAKLSRHLTSLAFLGAARIFHEVGDYKQAIYHYTQVRQLEPDFFEAVFEKAWSFYLNGDMNGALGVTLSFYSPYFETSYFPEIFVVRAAAFYQLCYFDRAATTVQLFKTQYVPILNQLKELMRREPSTWLFNQALLKTMDPKIVGMLVADTHFRTAMRAYKALEEEALKLSGKELSLNSQALRTLGSRLTQRARFLIAKSEQELQKWLGEADAMEIEILQSGANLLLGRSPDEKMTFRTIDLANVDFDALINFWTYKKEFWIDELGSYYYGLKSLCS